jgi:hypothetical protein
MGIQRDQFGYYRGDWRGREVRLPSVTTVLGLFADYSHVNESIMDRAAEFGTAVHNIVDLHEKGTLLESSLEPGEIEIPNLGKVKTADMRPILDAWKKCRLEKNIGHLETEMNVASIRHGFAGRLDAVGLVDGIGSIIEIKSRPFNSMLEPLQTAAYREAWNESTEHANNIKAFPIAIRRIFVELRLDGTYDWRPMKGKHDFQYFKCCLAAFNWRENNGNIR